MVAVLGWLQRARAVQRDGWNVLTPSPMSYVGLLIGVGLTGAALYVYNFVGLWSAAEIWVCQILIAVFALLTLVMFYTVAMVVTRWNDDCIEQSLMGYFRRTIRFADIVYLRYKPWLYEIRIEDGSGTRIDFPDYQNGAEQLVYTLVKKLGLDR